LAPRLRRKAGDTLAPAPQPGKKPALIDADTGPSNSVAHQMYKDGHEPRVHVDTPDETGEDATKP
jgi:hypothetical protein